MTLFPEAGFDAIAPPLAAPSGSFHFRISERSRCFEGHFDREPILPGIAHLALVLTACAQRDEGGRRRILIGARDIRFRRKLLPSEEVEIVLTDGREPFSVGFEIRCGGERATTGVLLFAPQDDPHHA